MLRRGRISKLGMFASRAIINSEPRKWPDKELKRNCSAKATLARDLHCTRRWLVGWLTVGRSNWEMTLPGRAVAVPTRAKFVPPFALPTLTCLRYKQSSPQLDKTSLSSPALKHFDLARPTANFPPHRLGVIHLSMSFHLASIVEPQQLRPCIFASQASR
jgi:hypothetical protein